MSNIWLNNAHASQRDVAALILRDLGDDVAVLVSHKQRREDIYMVADDFVLEPKLSEEAGSEYVEWALGVVDEHRVDAMLAMRHRLSIAGARKRFADLGVRVAAGATSVEAIDLCEHKDRFAVRMGMLGIPVPITIRVDTAEELANAILAVEAHGHGVCVKPVLGVYGRGYWRLQRNAPLHDVFSGVSEHTVDPEVFVDAFAAAKSPKPLIVMQHLPGDEYSIDCVCNEGVLVAHARRRKTTLHQEISTGGAEVEIAARIVHHLGLDGMVNVQTRADHRGNPHVLEVNTRPSGGIGYSQAAGINLPACFARMVLGKPVGFRPLGDPVAIRIGEDPYVLPNTSMSLRRSFVA